MAVIAISTLVLCVVLFLVARKEAEISLPMILMIAAGANIAGLLLSLAHPLAPLLSLVLLAWAIQRFCYVRWSKAWIVTGVYLAVRVGLIIGSQQLSKPA